MLLFVLAHAAGGMALVLLAALAGLMYAAAILPHFILNAVHFVAFTYPAIG